MCVCVCACVRACVCHTKRKIIPLVETCAVSGTVWDQDCFHSARV